MGRFNNRRAQERAAQDRNTPSRARFSKGPPKKNAGRGGRGGGRDGGRGGRTAANEAVVQKLQDRAKQQRKDIGGISIVKKQNAAATSTIKRKHPLDGIDVSKLDLITLSLESVAIVERLLKAYNVWDGDDADVTDEEKKSDDGEFDAFDVSEAIEEETDISDEIEMESVQQEDANEQFGNDLEAHSFALLHGDDSYDDYCGDYDDEPDYGCNQGFETINSDSKAFSMDRDHAKYQDESDEDMESCDDQDNSQNERDRKLIETPLFKHLTQHYSFQQQNVLQALNASHKRLYLSKKNEEAPDDKTAANDDGALLEMAMDWLSLHLNESDLRRGFLVQTQSKQSSFKSFMEAKNLNNHPGLNQTIKAVPHESISIMPKLTETQYKKENKEAMCQWKRQELSTELVRIGFHLSEVESATSLFKQQLENVFGDEGGTPSQPANVLDGAVFKKLVECVESADGSSPPCDLDIERDMEEASVIERDQEREVLEAIYAEDFQLLNHDNESTDQLHHHYQLKVNITNLAPPARNDLCHLHILTRPGYPLISPPLVWFVNATLPPSLLRRISTNIQARAHKLIGQAPVYDLVEYLAENIAVWQREYMNEEAKIEESAANDVIDKLDGNLDDDDEIDFYTTTFTAEERKKLSRRQRQKLRAAEKSHTRDEILLEKKRIKEQKDEERRERIRIEDSTITARRAEKVVEMRWKEWVNEEAEKAARTAMNDAFLRDETREQAREAAEKARVEMLRFHGELPEEEAEDEITAKADDQGEYDTASVNGDRSAAASNKPSSIDQSESPSNTNADQSTTRTPAATPKTLAFTEKLRRMYEQKAKEKSEGNSGSDDGSRWGTIHLSKATSVDTSITNESAPSEKIPAPVVTPSPCVEHILQDILTTQAEQPWLIQPDARVPTVGSDNKNETDHTLSIAEASQRDKISNSLRVELERKYKSGQGRNNKDRRRHRPNSKFEEMMFSRSKLPAYKMRDEVLDTIRNNQITVVSGDTGCGKTTQVPQLVLDDLIFNNRGADANIIVTQPRRISAIGVSERIAAERCERIGETVGYSIRLESKRSPKTRLLLCTTGVLLRRLQVDPDLASVSHVFVDEVHERDLNTDFLLIILKDLLRRRPLLKLVLMSATLNAETFSSWFGGVPTVSIPGRAQPVREYRLEDALQVTGHLILEQADCAKKKKPGDNSRSGPSKTSLRRMYPNYSKNVIDSLAVVDESVINYELIAELLQYICTSLEKGAILVFLPGFKEITTAMEAISKLDFFRDSNAIILPLHSTLSNAEQTAIFQRPPEGKRKIVLSTNIAETSITIDDVVFVVDAGRVKENRYDDLNKMPTLVESWVSKASAKQRRGRAGRVKPGYCWHLYSTHTHDQVIDDYQLPEMLRVGLEDLVLQILVLDLGEPSQFLKKAVNPPTDLAIKNALDLLESLGAAECNWDDKELDASVPDVNVTTSLTALGYHLATLPVHPRVGKMMIYGSLFGVYDSCLTIAAAMTSRSPFISSFDNRDAADKAKRGFASDDHISVLLAFNTWRDLKQRDGKKARTFLRENFLSYTSLSNMVQLRKQLEKYMLDIGFSAPKAPSSLISMDSNDMHLVRAVIAAGLYPNIIVAPKSFSGKAAGEVAFRGQKSEVYLHPCTIAFTMTELDSRYCCYHEIVKTSKVYIRDCTAVSKFAILLFGGTLKVYQSHGVAAVDDWLKFRIHAKPATLVKYLRSSMEALLLEKIMNPEYDVTGSSKGKAVIFAVSALLKMESVQKQ